METKAETEWQPKGKFHEESGTHYILSEIEDVGSNPDDYEIIVTIHGVDGFSYVYDHFHSEVLNRNSNIDTKQKKYRILQYDLIGRGHSKPSKNNQYTENEYIEQLRSLIEHLGLNKNSNYHVVGLSMGGAVAALYCEKFHHEVKSCTLLAPVGLMHLPELEYIRAIPFLGWLLKYPMQWMELNPANSRTFYNREGVYEDRFNYMIRMKKAAYENNPHQLDSTFQTKMQFPFYGLQNNVSALGNIKDFPIHIIFADKDVVVPFEYNYNRWKDHLLLLTQDSSHSTSSSSLDNNNDSNRNSNSNMNEKNDTVTVNESEVPIDNNDNNHTSSSSSSKANTTFTVVPNAGHNILLEIPDDAVDIILKFIQQFK